MSVTQAAVLAAGAGKKCWPYTDTRPKALLPVANRALIDRLLSQLREVGVESVVVATAPGENGDALRRHLAREVDVTCVTVEPTGTAAALEGCLPALDDTRPILVAYGDIVTHGSNIDALLSTGQRDDVVRCLVDGFPDDEPRGWIAAETSGEQLDRLVGGARSGSRRLSGLFVLGPSFREFVKGAPNPMRSVPVGGMPGREAELASAVNASIENGHDVGAVDAPEFHVDVDKPWHILVANVAVVTERVGTLEDDEIHPSASVHEGADIRGNAYLGPDATVGDRVVMDGNVWVEKGATVTNGAIIGGDCLIGRNASVTDHCHLGSRSVVGADCRVGHAAEFGGVLFDGVAVVHYSQLSGIIGERTDIGAATVSGGLRFDDGKTVHDTNGFREQPDVGANAVYLGDFSRTGVNVVLHPGVKLGAYSCVGPGAILTDDVDSGTLVEVKQELVEHSWGPERYGW